jgi:dynein heavy chain
VTPTSYLELLRSYRTLLSARQNDVATVKRRYEVGLQKLDTTESSVGGMKLELIALQPQLAVAAKDTEAAMVVITRESGEADKVKQVVSKEEASASAEAAKVKAIKEEVRCSPRCHSDIL